MSLHRYDDQTFYPRRKDGDSSHVGQNKGLGFNVNVAWQTGLQADEDNRENN
jgi:acetoin utilization deacetylase AcuC-like enzyme